MPKCLPLSTFLVRRPTTPPRGARSSPCGGRGLALNQGNPILVVGVWSPQYFPRFPARPPQCPQPARGCDPPPTSTFTPFPPFVRMFSGCPQLFCCLFYSEGWIAQVGLLKEARGRCWGGVAYPDLPSRAGVPRKAPVAAETARFAVYSVA